MLIKVLCCFIASLNVGVGLCFKSFQGTVTQSQINPLSTAEAITISNEAFLDNYSMYTNV